MPRKEGLDKSAVTLANGEWICYHGHNLKHIAQSSKRSSSGTEISRQRN